MQVGLTEFLSSEVQQQTVGILIGFSAKMPHLHKAPNRCGEIRSAPFATSVRRITSADVARRYANFAHL